MMEMRLILAMVAGRYRLRSATGEVAEPASIGILRPRRGPMLTPQAIA